jgi:hypothetical protein
MSDVALVLSADKYEIPDERTGEIQSLHQVWYINNYREDSERERGSKPIKMLVAPEVFSELFKHQLPSLFDLDVRTRPGKGNSVSATVVGFKHVGTPQIFPTVPAKKAA